LSERRNGVNQDEAERKRHALIQRRAYEIYQSRGGQHGFDEEDWLQAEIEVDGLRSDDDRLPLDENEEPDERTDNV
jgi:hypothetical protein